ncbi:hypothetical protein N657DRAFT_404031 [Parathielavia appendiculata]|uniref:Uncharacterized protein n=1 Tax=Parathielavia appendiculata TaxID=2587402 RepID=A0AAN6TPE2_9PEZI|nr:hypothetical protein N657DRAFT_404031 [Parathielavia appendiculata]
MPKLTLTTSIAFSIKTRVMMPPSMVACPSIPSIPMLELAFRSTKQRLRMLLSNWRLSCQILGGEPTPRAKQQPISVAIIVTPRRRLNLDFSLPPRWIIDQRAIVEREKNPCIGLRACRIGCNRAQGMSTVGPVSDVRTVRYLISGSGHGGAVKAVGFGNEYGRNVGKRPSISSS